MGGVAMRELSFLAFALMRLDKPLLALQGYPIDDSDHNLKWQFEYNDTIHCGHCRE